MIVTEREGNIFDEVGGPEFQAFAHGCNVRGVMGAGVALGFKACFPTMYGYYKMTCDRGDLQPGGIYVWWEPRSETTASPFPGQWVYNLATQDDPGANARIEWVALSVAAMVNDMRCYEGVTKVATVRLGCGIGGLSWGDVKPALEAIDSDMELVVFRPVGT